MSVAPISPTIANSAVRAAKQVIEKSRLLDDNDNYRNISPASFAAARLRILDKDKRLLPLTYNRAQADLMANLTGRDLILKARQLGVSTVVQGMLYQAVVTGTATTMTLAHDNDGTQTLRRMTDRYWRNDPQQPKRGAANAVVTTYPVHDSEALIATAGNLKSGRSTTLTYMHGSEVAFWPDAESIVSGAMQAGNPQVILESTPNGAQGYFYNLCMEALDGNSDWRLHFYPWWWDAAYFLPLDADERLDYTADEATLVKVNNLSPEQIKWRRAKQRELKHKFLQEYPEDPETCFLRSGFGYFGDIADRFVILPGTVYHPDHRYVAGLDFAQTLDFTTLSIIDATLGIQVARLRINRLAWSEMRRQVVAMCKAWHVKRLVAEKNSMGSTNIEELVREFEREHPWTQVKAFETSNESKASIMSALNETMHAKDGLKLLNQPTDGDPGHQYDAQKRELNAFIAMQLPSGAWRLAAPEGEHDDTVIALALSWEAARSHEITATAKRYA